LKFERDAFYPQHSAIRLENYLYLVFETLENFQEAKYFIAIGRLSDV
jgi:hypothetical protein